MARPLRIDYADACLSRDVSREREADCLRVFAMTKANMCARKARPDLHGG